jgi:hypothetical protein
MVSINRIVTEAFVRAFCRIWSMAASRTDGKVAVGVMIAGTNQKLERAWSQYLRKKIFTSAYSPRRSAHGGSSPRCSISCLSYFSLKIEYFPQQGFPFPVAMIASVRTLGTVMIGFALRGWRRLRSRTLYELVQLPAIQPNATAFGTIVDLDALTVGYH